MADPTKLRCKVDGCKDVSEVKAEWKFGKGVEIPFGNGGRCGSPTGMHHELLLCKAHRLEAMAMRNRPYRVTLTAWAKHPDKYEALLTTDAGVLEFTEAAK